MPNSILKQGTTFTLDYCSILIIESVIVYHSHVSSGLLLQLEIKCEGRNFPNDTCPIHNSIYFGYFMTFHIGIYLICTMGFRHKLISPSAILPIHYFINKIYFIRQKSSKVESFENSIISVCCTEINIMYLFV